MVFFMTLVGMSLDWADFNLSRLFISLIVSFKVNFLNENGKASCFLNCFFISSILGGFQISFVAFNTGSWGRLLFGQLWVSTFDTIFKKYSLKIFASSLSFDTTFLFSIKIILSSFKVLSVKHDRGVARI